MPGFQPVPVGTARRGVSEPAVAPINSAKNQAGLGAVRQTVPHGQQTVQPERDTQAVQPLQPDPTPRPEVGHDQSSAGKRVSTFDKFQTSSANDIAIEANVKNNQAPANGGNAETVALANTAMRKASQPVTDVQGKDVAGPAAPFAVSSDTNGQGRQSSSGPTSTRAGRLARSRP